MFDEFPTLLISLFALILWQAPTLTAPDFQAMVQRSVKLHQNWSEAANTPGSSVEAKEIARKRGDAYTAVTYNIFVKGLPLDKVYNLVEFEITTLQQTVSTSGITIGKDGIAICAGRPGTCGTAATPDAPIQLILPSTKGQGRHLALISQDGKLRAMFLLVPFPIRSQDNDCQLEVQRLMPGAELVYISSTGFPPGALIKLESDSAGEKQSRDVKADAHGDYNSAILPGVIGRTSGTLHVTLRGTVCSPSASIEWGKESIHYE
jgi:hypothetical protein